MNDPAGPLMRGHADRLIPAIIQGVQEYADRADVNFFYGRRLYSWVEATIDDLGRAVPHPSGRWGTFAVAPAFEANETLAWVGCLVWLRLAADRDVPAYEFLAPPSGPGTTPPAADCGPGCGWAAGLRADDCLRLTLLSATGTCTAEASDPDETLAWDGATSTWAGADVTIAGTAYTPNFSLDPNDGAPRLSFTEGEGSSGGGTDHYCTLDCCGQDYAVFSLGGTTFCPGTPDCPPDPPHVNVLRFKVAWEVCANPDYFGAGWYCVSLPATPLVNECVHYASDPGTCATIHSGPWDSEADCTGPCGGTPPDPMSCQGINFDTATGGPGITGHVTNKTSTATCLPDVLVLSSPDVDAATFSHVECEGTPNYFLACTGGYYAMTCSTPSYVSFTLVSWSVSPFVLVYDVTFLAGGGIGGAGTARFTFTSP